MQTQGVHTRMTGHYSAGKEDVQPLRPQVSETTQTQTDVTVSLVGPVNHSRQTGPETGARGAGGGNGERGAKEELPARGSGVSGVRTTAQDQALDVCDLCSEGKVIIFSLLNQAVSSDSGRLASVACQ